MPSVFTRLAGLIPGYTPRPMPPAVVTETADQRAGRLLAQTQQQLDRSRRRSAPGVGDAVPSNYHRSGGWFLPYADSATKDTPEIRAAMRLMLRDGYVKAAWEPQIATVASEDWQIQPSEPGNGEAEEQGEFVTRVFGDYLAGGMPSLVRAVCAALGSDGYSLAEKVWAIADKGRLEGKVILRAAKTKDTEFLRIHGDEFNTILHVESVRRPEEKFPITDFLYARYLPVFDEPLGTAAFRPAYAPYWMRDTVRKLRVVHTEKKMAGFLVGTYATDDDKGPLELALKAARSATWAAVPEGTRIEAIQLSTATEPDYKSFDESLRDEIVLAIAFATLQILTSNTVGDQRGSSDVQKTMADLGPWLLMSLVQQVVNEQLIPDLIDFNYPYPAAGGYPKLTFGAVSNSELLELVQVVQGAQAIGLKPSKKYYAKALSIQEADPNDPDDQLQAGGGQPPMPPGGGFGGGFGQPDPFGGGGGGAMFSEGWSRPTWESFAWQPAKSRTGNVKAVGTAEDAGRALYGQAATAALARQGRADRGEPEPPHPSQERARQLAREREPAREEARGMFVRALEAPDKITPEEMAGLKDRMATLTRDELRGFARNMAARVGGLKPELVARLVGKARGQVAAADAWNQLKPPGATMPAATPPGAGNAATAPADGRPGPVPEPERGAAAGRVDAGNAGGTGAEAVRPRVVTTRADLTPAGNPALVPEGVRRHLTETQTQGVSLAIDAMRKHGGFLLADGTGVGKTRQILAVGQSFLDAGKKVIVVSPAEVIKPDWNKGTMTGSFAADSGEMGVRVRLTKGDAPLSPGVVNVTTYNELGKLKDQIGKDTVVLFDEAHAMKNRTSARYKAGKEAQDKAAAVMFATATPGDKPMHIAYLARAGVFGTAGASNTYEKLGMELHDQHIGGGRYQKVWRINPKVGYQEATRRIAGLFDQMTRDGLMVKRELSMDGVEVGLEHVPLPADQRAAVEKVYSDVLAKTDGNKAVALMAARLYQEPLKIPATVGMVRDELAAGRSPVVFVGRVNDIDAEDGEDDDEVKAALAGSGHSSEGTAGALKAALIAAGVPAADIGELHGGATTTAAQKKKAMDQFQANKTKVIIATVQSGGTGINLDDITGTRPRTVVMVTPPFTANDMSQAIGRIHRLNTKSAAKVRGVLADTEIDRWNADLLNRKFRTLGAIAGGEATRGAAAAGQTIEPDTAEPYQWGTSLLDTRLYVNTPYEHNAVIAQYGGARVNRGTRESPVWTTSFPSPSHYERYRAATAAPAASASPRPTAPAPPKLTVSGDTYPHREVIKSLGGRWDGDRKVWVVPASAAARLPRGLTAR